MVINIVDYMNNPSGKGSNVIPNRQLLKDDFKKRYEKLKKGKKIHQTIYMIKDSYFFHVKIPSEDLEKDMYYDVVIEFYPHDKSNKTDFNIKNYGLRLFSNSPSFVYTYAYVYNKHGILSTDSRSKFNDITMSSPPVTRNPNEIISFEKTIYFACLNILSSNRYTQRMYIETVAKKLDTKKLYSKVRSSDEIEVEYGKAKHKKQKAKEEENKQILGKTRQNNPSSSTKKITATKSTSKNHKTGSITKKKKITGVKTYKKK